MKSWTVRPSPLTCGREPRPIEVPLVVRPPDIAAAIRAVEKILPISIPDEQEKPHKFVASTGRALRQSLRAGRRNPCDLVCPAWDFNDPTTLLSIHVMEASIPRALRLANAILRAAIAAGFKVESVRQDGLDRVHLTVLDEPFDFSISERRKQVPHLLTAEDRDQQKKYKHSWSAEFDYESTGDLTLSIWPAGHKYQAVVWKEGKRSRLEDMIGQVLLGLPVRVQELREAREARRLAEIRHQEEAEQRWEEEQRRREEQQRVDALLKNVQEWRTAENVREYVRVVEAAMREMALDDDAKIQRWIAWANDVADHLTLSAKSASRTRVRHQTGHGETGRRKSGLRSQ